MCLDDVLCRHNDTLVCTFPKDRSHASLPRGSALDNVDTATSACFFLTLVFFFTIAEAFFCEVDVSFNGAEAFFFEVDASFDGPDASCDDIDVFLTLVDAPLDFANVFFPEVGALLIDTDFDASAVDASTADASASAAADCEEEG